MADKEWSDENRTDAHRANLIRFYYADYFRAPSINNADALDTNAGILAVNGGATKFGAPYSANHYPTQANVKAFRENIITNLREYTDGVGFTINSRITDKMLSDLAGDHTLAGAGNKVSLTGFISNAGNIRGGGDSREIGIAKEDFLRDMKQSAVLAPDEYILKSNLDIKNIEEKALVVFRESFRKYYEDYKYSSEEAKRLAKSDYEVYRGLLMKQHKAIYNVDVYNKAEQRIVKNIPKATL